VKYFCSHPWKGLDIDPQGNYKPCCRYNKSVATTFNEYINSEELLEIKKEFITGNKPKGCEWCWQEENSGIVSKRQTDWTYIFDEQMPDLDKTEIVHLTFSFGSTCTLACVICSSYASSRWVKEARNLDIVPIYKHNKSYRDPDFLDILNVISKNIKRVEITGGEPFLAGIKEHLAFLTQLKQVNPDIVLCYTTNGISMPTQEFLDIWQHFKKVEIRLSIDGISTHYEYNRWPALWSEVTSNIKVYQNWQTEFKNIELKVIHVVSIFTIYYLPEFLRWSLKNNLGKPYLQILSDPPMYDIRVLPKSIKDKIIDKLSKYNVQSLLTHLTSIDIDDKFNDALLMIQKLEQQRNNSFSETFPEFYQLIKDAGCQI